MKKLIAILSLLAMVLGPTSALAVDTQSVGTSVTQDPGSGEAPIVKAKWESLRGSAMDDDTAKGAQFLPSATYQVDKQFQVCGVVTDPDGVADIENVYGDIWYPEEIYLGENHETGRQGCGQMVQTECKMVKLGKVAGYEAFCGAFPGTTNEDVSVRYLNNNLPTFAEGYTYDEICKADGELMKETAYVYCCDRTLSYEDPSGNYETIVYAQDSTGKSNYLLNEFTYKPVTAFETDFTSIGYGNVKLLTEKIINGDLTWGASLATVRNIGNTRLQMGVNQDDMGFGMTGSTYNVKYKARVGNNSADWKPYNPNAATTWLLKTLDLSETNEMDFGITVLKFPPLHDASYSGDMTLTARSSAHLNNCCPTLDVSPE